MLFSKPQHFVFFDFGRRTTKVAHVVKQRKVFRVETLRLCPTPEHGVSEEAPSQPLLIKQLIQELLSQLPTEIENGSFHLTAPDPHTILKRVEIPKPLPKELNQQMLFEAETVCPYPIEEAVVDYTFLDTDPFFQRLQNQKVAQVLLTISKQTSIQPWLSLFEELDIPLSYISPASVGLMNVGLNILRSHGHWDRLVMTHLGDQSTLLVYLSKTTFRFLYLPTGLSECIHDTVKQCDLDVSEGRYLAEHLDQKDIPDIFLTVFNNSASRFFEKVGDSIVELVGAKPGQKLPVFFSGGPSRLHQHIKKCFSRFSEFDTHRMTFESHLSRKNIVLSPGVSPSDLSTGFPSLIGHLEAMSL